MNRTIEWLNLNSYRRYPLVDDADYEMTHYTLGVREDYLFTDDVLLDFKAVFYDIRNYELVLESFDIISASNTFRLKLVRYNVDTAESQLMWVDVPGNAAFPFTVTSSVSTQYRITVTFGPGVEKFMALADGNYRFTYAPEILPTLLASQYRYRVNRVQGSSTDSINLAGIIFIEEGYNISVKIDSANSIVYISAFPGAGKGVSCETLAGARSPGTVIKKVNNLPPTPDGNINILPSAGIDIAPGAANTLVIKATLDIGQENCNG